MSSPKPTGRSGPGFRAHGSTARPYRTKLYLPYCESIESRTLLSTFLWTNPSGGDWDTAANWVNMADPTDHQVPQAGDIAEITTPGITVTHDNPDTDEVSQLTTGNTVTLEISSGSLTIDTSASIGDLNLNGGILSNSGTLTVSGAITWNAGDLSGSGTSYAEGGLAIVDGLLDGQTLNNEATATLSGGVLYMADGATLDNTANATFTITDDSPIFDAISLVSNGGVIDNEGMFSKDGVTGNSAIEVPIMQSGAGALPVETGSLSLDAPCSFGGTGQLTVSADVALLFRNGPTTIAATSGMTGAGTAQFERNVVTDLGTYNVTGSTIVDGGDAELMGPVASLGNIVSITPGDTDSTLDLSGANVFTVSTLTLDGTLTNNGS